MAKRINETEKLIKVKVYVEQIRYAAQRIDKTFSFNSKDINSALESVNNNLEQRQAKTEIIKSAYSNLKNTLTNDLRNQIDELKSIEKLLMRVLK